MLTEIYSNINTSKNEIRKFSILIGLIFLIVAFIFYLNGNLDYNIFIFVGLIIIGFGLIIPTLIKPIYFIFMILANIFGLFMSKVILGILYFTMITPIGIIGRLCKKQFIELKWDDRHDSYWNNLSNEEKKYDKQF